MEHYYKIYMDTPLGIRRGSMKFLIEKDRVFGKLTILENTEPFSGTIKSSGINDSGELFIKGIITSAVRTMEYVATGRIINGEQLVLEIRHKERVYQVKGHRCHDHDRKGGLED